MRVEIPSSLTVLILCTCSSYADDASTASSTAVFRPVTEQAAAGNAALFIGVNEFTEDLSIQPLQFAVHDAIEQAHLFVVRLKLIPAGNCYIALSGAPSAGSVQQHLTELKQRGVHVLDADKSAMLKSLLKVRTAARDESNLLIIGISSHGFDDGKAPYVMPRDGLRQFLAETAIRLRSIEEQMRLSEAGHRLFLVDACQEKVSFAPEKSVSANSASAMDATFLEALSNPTGQAKLASCNVGEFSYEYGGLRGCGHGVFTANLLDALDGGAAADEDGLIRMRAVADYVHDGVNRWVEDMNRHGGDEMKQSPSWFGPKSAEALPLAMKAGDIITLITGLKNQKLSEGFEANLRDKLIAHLKVADSSRTHDRDLILTTRDYLDGQIPSRLFIPYLQTTLKSTAKDNADSPDPVQEPAKIATREAMKSPVLDTPLTTDRASSAPQATPIGEPIRGNEVPVLSGQFIVSVPETRSFDGNLAGTHWKAKDSQGDTYELYFLADGELYYDAGRGLRRNGTWKTDGANVAISINDGFATFSGRISGRSMSGSGRSRTVGAWNWTALPQ